MKGGLKILLFPEKKEVLKWEERVNRIDPGSSFLSWSSENGIPPFFSSSNKSDVFSSGKIFFHLIRQRNNWDWFCWKEEKEKERREREKERRTKVNGSFQIIHPEKKEWWLGKKGNFLIQSFCWIKKEVKNTHHEEDRKKLIGTETHILIVIMRNIKKGGWSNSLCKYC